MVETKPTGSGWGSNLRAPAAHGLFLPGRRLHLDRKSFGAGRQQEVTALRGFEIRTLTRAQMKCVLKLGRLARPLCTEENDGRIRSHDRALI
jgi:hypothetical protein